MFVVTIILLKIKTFVMQKSLGLLLGAAAAFGIYKYSKMSPEQKNNLKAKAKDFMNRRSGFGNLFGKKQAAANDNNNF